MKHRYIPFILAAFSSAVICLIGFSLLIAINSYLNSILYFKANKSIYLLADYPSSADLIFTMLYVFIFFLVYPILKKILSRFLQTKWLHFLIFILITLFIAYLIQFKEKAMISTQFHLISFLPIFFALFIYEKHHKQKQDMVDYIFQLMIIAFIFACLLKVILLISFLTHPDLQSSVALIFLFTVHSFFVLSAILPFLLSLNQNVQQ